MRKILSLFLCLLLLSVSAVMMSGCAEKEEFTVEFVLPEFFTNHPPTYNASLFPNLVLRVKHSEKVQPINLSEKLTDHQKTRYSCLNESWYTFIGWFQEEGCISVWKFYETPVTCNMTLYAKYVPNEELI